jgi:uncharacterized protein (UPF0333 family)
MFILVLLDKLQIVNKMAKMNKKGQIVIGIILLIVLIALIISLYILYKNFHMTCIWDNLKSFSNLNMTNCKR